MKKIITNLWAGNFYSKNYTEYESNEDEIKTLSIEECLNKIRL